jgi:superfamily II DNA or RNA helicase
MANFKDLNWKGTYKSGTDNDDLLKDFYIPVLSCATSYKRAVGYFSSSLLAKAAEGLGGLIQSNGTMQLIIGEPLKNDEYEAVRDGLLVKEYGENLCNNIFEMIDGKYGAVTKYRGEILAWLIGKGILEIRFAYRKGAMYHDKFGIVVDSSGDKIVFTGTANETVYGVEAGKNKESLSVFLSWEEETYKKYGSTHELDFEKLWHGEESDTYTVALPSESYEKIAKLSESIGQPGVNREAAIIEIERLKETKNELKVPTIPKKMGGKDFVLKEHQKTALNSWANNDYRGLFRLATGSGKTITSIYAAVRLYESWEKIAVVISVPYVELAKQWITVLSLFGIEPIQCFGSKKIWIEGIGSRIQEFNIKSRGFLCILAVNKTLSDSELIENIGKINEEDLLFIGDECHRLASQHYFKALPNANYRIGLSATPFVDDDDELETPFPNEAKERLLAYFGGVVSDYTLEDAINDDVLTKYEYHVQKIKLTEDEQIRYEKITSEIAKLVYSGNNSSGMSEGLSAKFGERSRLLGAASNKLVEFKSLLLSKKWDKKYTLVYCAEGKVEEGDFENYIENVSGVLKEAGWKASRFTSQESSGERTEIMSAFKTGVIDALVSMKVLDEGIDVPVCKQAFILASTRNQRQYVQRRGRILRKHESKSHAVIYDFMICPCQGYEETSASRSLVKAEKERVYDFVKLSINKNETLKLLRDLD